MQRSDQINELMTALAKAQAMMRPAPKDSINPHFKSRYSDLASVTEAIREPLTSNGLALIQFPATDGPKVTVTSLLGHTSGQWISGELTLVAQQATPQGVGSTITYGRRYGAMAITGLSSDDDDGEQASKPAASKAPAKKQEPQYNPGGDDIPFAGSPAKIGQKEEDGHAPTAIRYAADAKQRLLVGEYGRKYGITRDADFLNLSKFLLANGGVEMEHIESVIKTWAADRSKGR